MVTGDAEGLAAALASGAPSPMKYASEKSEEILAEDRHIAIFPLGIDSESIRVVAVEDMFERGDS